MMSFEQTPENSVLNPLNVKFKNSIAEIISVFQPSVEYHFA